MSALPFLFFASGALGLVYEVLWMRRLTLLFGATPLATTATLSGFFLGLAAGSRVFGARAARWRHPLQAFGLLEIGVGLGALCFEPVLGLYGRAYPSLQAALAPYPAAFALVKLILAMAAVGLPAFCMGGTLPALGEAVAPGGQRLGIPVGRLYAINLLGATAGTLAVPFLLLPRLGSDGSYFGAVGGSVAIGLVAWLAGTRSAPAPGAQAGRPPRQGAAGPLSTRAVLRLSALSGLVTLALQVSWTRMSALVHENSLYSFAVVVFVFLLGLAGGAALARLGLRRGLPAVRLLGFAWVAAGALVAASPRLFHTMTGGLAYLSAESWSASLLRLLTLALATMLPATLALGMAVPLLMELAGERGEGSPGPVLGRLLAANTMGAILGPLLATFVLGPRLGLWWSLVALGALATAAGAYAGLTRTEKAVAAAVFLGLLALLRPAALPAVRVRGDAGERLVSIREGSHGTTAVIADARDRWITVNNSYVLGGTAAAAEERFQADLPLLLHPAPRRVAFLGMGTGITAGAALHHPVEEVIALEIVPEVVEAARADFADENARFLDDPRVRVVTDDGRHYLASPPHRFEVIVGDLLVPWRAGEAPLYSREHFESVRRALTADGLFCQWLPLYQLSPEQVTIILRTFADVFPQASLWRGNFIPEEPTLAVIGHSGAAALDPVSVDERVRRLAPAIDPSQPFLKHPAGLWLFLVGPLGPETPGLSAARANSDRHPWIELLSPLTHSGRGQPALVVESVAHAPLDGTSLRRLDAAHQGWRGAGGALAKASLERGEEGKARVLAILQTLPPELQRALGLDGR